MLAVIVLNGTSRRRPLPRFVCFGYRGERSIFVVGRGLAPAVFAVDVYDGRGDPPTNIGVRFGNRGEVTVTLASLV